MYKLAILGCENSHADNFLRLIAEGKYPQMEVIGIYSNEPEAAKKLHDKFGTPIMEHYGDLAGQVDGVIITARHGDNHFLYAKPYLADGIPMFIDKPITCSNAEGEEFMAEAKARGIRLCGGSTCAATEETYALAETVMNIMGGSSNHMILKLITGPVITAACVSLPIFALSIASAVIRYMALYDVYTSMDPSNNVLFLVLSIFFGVTEPFFLFFNRNRDDGMPPRKDAAPEEPPVQTETDPWDRADKNLE